MNDMTNACHRLAEIILRSTAKTAEEKWLKRTICESLVDKARINDLTSEYRATNPYQTEYLAALLKTYEEAQ